MYSLSYNWKDASRHHVKDAFQLLVSPLERLRSQ